MRVYSKNTSQKYETKNRKPKSKIQVVGAKDGSDIEGVAGLCKPQRSHNHHYCRAFYHLVLEAWIFLCYGLVLKEIGREFHMYGGVGRGWKGFKSVIRIMRRLRLLA